MPAVSRPNKSETSKATTDLSDSDRSNSPDEPDTSLDSVKFYYRSLGNFEKLNPEEDALIGKRILSRRQSLRDAFARHPGVEALVEEYFRKKPGPGAETEAPRDRLDGVDLLAVTREIIKQAKSRSASNRRTDPTVESIEAAFEQLISARNELVTRHRRFGGFMAREVAKSYGIRPDAESFAAADVALIEAADRFDPERGTKFITYARWILLTRLTEHFQKTAGAGLGKSIRRRIARINQFRASVIKEQGREPDISEISSALKLSKDVVGDALELERWTKLLKIHDHGDHENAGDDFNRLVRTGPSVWRMGDALDILLKTERRALAHKAIAALPSKRERDWIKQRHNFDEKGERKLEELGRAQGLSRERARQVVTAVEAKLASWLSGLKSGGNGQVAIPPRHSYLRRSKGVLNLFLRYQMGTLPCVLRPEEEEVLKMHLGIDRDRPLLHREVAAQFGKTTEAVKGLYIRAIDKLFFADHALKDASKHTLVELLVAQREYLVAREQGAPIVLTELQEMALRWALAWGPGGRNIRKTLGRQFGLANAKRRTRLLRKAFQSLREFEQDPVPERFIVDPYEDNLVQSYFRALGQGLPKLLSPKEERVVRARFGVAGSPQHFYPEIAKSEKSSIESVTAIKELALKKIKVWLETQQVKPAVAAKADEARSILMDYRLNPQKYAGVRISEETLEIAIKAYGLKDGCEHPDSELAIEYGVQATAIRARRLFAVKQLKMARDKQSAMVEWTGEESMRERYRTRAARYVVCYDSKTEDIPKISDRKRKLLFHFFGLRGESARSAEELGERFGIYPSVVRKELRSALAALANLAGQEETGTNDYCKLPELTLYGGSRREERLAALKAQVGGARKRQ